MLYPIPPMRILRFTECTGAPLVRTVSVGWADLPTHSWDYDGADSAFWVLYRNSHDGTTITIDAPSDPAHPKSIVLKPRHAYLIPPRIRWSRRNLRDTRNFYAYLDVFDLETAHLPGIIPISGAAALPWLSDLAATPRAITAVDAAHLAHLALGALIPYAQIASPARALATNRIAPALQAMQNDPARPWSLPQLARMCGGSADTFGRNFRAAHGCTPVAWLHTLRVRSAARLLATGTHDLDVVARKSGFGSRPYLSRVFRSVMGIGPAAYRDAVRASIP